MTENFSNEIRDIAEGFALLSSCKLNESSYEWDEKQHGVFSYFLCDALSGYADMDRDGKVTVSEASKYVTRQVKEWAFANNRQQSPNLEYKVSGEITLTYVPGSFKPDNLTKATDVKNAYVTSITLLHSEHFPVPVEYSERNIDEWETVKEDARSAARVKAKALCAHLLKFYKSNELRVDQSKDYVFPDGRVSVSTYSDSDSQNVHSYLELTIDYDPAKRVQLDNLVKALSRTLEWVSVKFQCAKRFDNNRVVELCQKVDITIKSYDPSGTSPIIVSAPGWGATGAPATVYFENSGEGSSIRIFQRCYNADRLEEDFYEKLNPETIVEFIGSAFATD